MDDKTVENNELKLVCHYYEDKLIEVLGAKGFLSFSMECLRKLITTEAQEYIYGDSDVMPK